jgi:antitoxin CptB
MTEPDQAKNDAASDDPRDELRRRRLLFRATHRGTYENDLLIGGFVRNHLDALTEEDVAALEALMERPDPDLADWLTGRRPIAPEDATPMLLGIRASLVR